MESPKKYKAVEAFEFEGEQVEVGQELELGAATAADLGDKIAPVDESTRPANDDDEA